MELLVRVQDKCNPGDPVLDAQCLKRGDVVCAMPDGHQWSERERTNPEWRILRINLSDEDVSELLAESDDQNPLRSRRGCKIDLDSPELSKTIKGQVDDDKRAVSVIDLSLLTAQKIEALKVAVIDRKAEAENA